MLTAVARLIVKFSPAQDGILRLYIHYKRSQRDAQVAQHTLALAHIIQNEMQLVVKDERVVMALAVKMSQHIQSGQYSEAYFGELAAWIVALRRCPSQAG